MADTTFNPALQAKPLIADRARNDWNNYWSTAKAGDTQSWAGGMLTRNEDGSATLNKNGNAQTFNAATSMEELAAGNQDIANMWGGQYGVVKPVNAQLNFDPSTGYQSAALRGVSDNELTSNQIGKVLDANSPLIQQAVRRSMEQSNSRGLLNSSIAVGAGTEAAISQALPIASADAGAYQQAAQDNQNASNQFGLAKNNGIINSQLAGINADYALRNQQYGNDFTGSENEKHAGRIRASLSRSRHSRTSSSWPPTHWKSRMRVSMHRNFSGAWIRLRRR